ncbi:mechanosensitive ion channel family protein [Thaumasiovibrio sp. DFM-14]|uniref:mechanosensitive ion channel family protein n=1 Tax=Thaumasiovibrio sp. DFM-14 TaxID=3384792 RepID=UPI0039A178AE
MEVQLETIEQQLVGLLQGSWLLNVIVTLLVTSAAFILWRVGSTRLERYIRSTSLVWGEALWYAIRTPINWMIVLIGLTVLVRLVDDPSLNMLLYPVRQITVTALLVWASFRFIDRAEKEFIRRQQDATTINALGKLVSMIILVFAFLSIVQSLGVSISGILAFGGMGGLIVGMAAKDLLANFFGALVIYFDRPFKVGDWVRSPDRQIEGTVERIGWRVTVIRTFDKRPLYVPNAVFASIIVENPSRMTNRRIYETIGIRYDDSDKVSAIVADVKAMLLTHPEIDTNQTMIVNFNAFGPSSLDFFVYTFTKTTNWIHFHEVKHDVLEKILQIVARHHAQIAFPTQTLHLGQASQDGALTQLHTARMES